MTLIDVAWNSTTQLYDKTWLADDESELTPDFDPEASVGSAIIVIATNAVYVKNTKGKWQKSGTTEVLS